MTILDEAGDKIGERLSILTSVEKDAKEEPAMGTRRTDPGTRSLLQYKGRVSKNDPSILALSDLLNDLPIHGNRPDGDLF